MKDELNLSFRSIFFRRKQYFSLFLVCLFGVGISVFSLFLVDGMLSALENKAKIYYGGDYQFIGGDSGLNINNKDELFEKLKPVFSENTVITERYDLDAKYAAFYYEGEGVRQRVIKGIHFAEEKNILNSFNIVEGSIENFMTDQKNLVLLSEPIANMLNIHTGDELTFYIRNRHGYVDTTPLIVGAIFRDSSLFGMYTSYMDIDILRNMDKYPNNLCNRICISLPKNEKQLKPEEYQAKLEEIFTMYPLVNDKTIFYNDLGKVPMPTYALIKIGANLQDVQILIDAMKLIAAFVIIVLVVIIVAGVSSTFRVIVMKRINEIGIYKAIGMKRHKIYLMLIFETALLVILGCIAGFIFSLLLSGIVRCFTLSFIPAFDIFLVSGRLLPIISIKYFLIISFIVIVTTIFAVLFSIKKSVSITPCEALAITE